MSRDFFEKLLDQDPHSTAAYPPLESYVSADRLVRLWLCNYVLQHCPLQSRVQKAVQATYEYVESGVQSIVQSQHAAMLGCLGQDDIYHCAVHASGVNPCNSLDYAPIWPMKDRALSEEIGRDLFGDPPTKLQLGFRVNCDEGNSLLCYKCFGTGLKVVICPYCYGAGCKRCDTKKPKYMSSAATCLAKAAYDGEQVHGVLADELEMQDCNDLELMAHLRTGKHWRGCWAVDFLLNKRERNCSS